MALPELKQGAEAQVFHDRERGVVYKLFKVTDGRTGAYVPERMRMAEDGQVRIAAGPRPTFFEFLQRMARTNAQEQLTPTELVALTPDGFAVFCQPFVAGRRVSEAHTAGTLRKVGLHLITEMGGVAAIGQVNGRWVLFDDLHPGNIKVSPGGYVDVIDALNRELTDAEVRQLDGWGLLPMAMNA